MKKALVAVAAVLVGWVSMSILMLWPPISPYMGASRNACMNCLRQIEGAKEQWALENKRTIGPVDIAGVNQYLKGGTAPICEGGGIYTYGDVGQNPTCSLFGQPAPRPVKQRVGVIGWMWKVSPTNPAGHALP